MVYGSRSIRPALLSDSSVRFALMSSKREKQLPFIELYLRGKVLPEDIDDYVDRWNADPAGQEIYEFLGMSKEEYSLWLRDPNMLPHIARARRENKPPSRLKAGA